MTRSQGAPFVAVLGPTAAGKSELGMAVAERIGGEIVCCDSVQVYRGLDVGSGKPTAADRAAVPHHGLDVVDPDQPFDAAAWLRVAEPAVASIVARGRVPIVVGGTGLYYRALVQGLFDAPPADPAIRERHRQEAAERGTEALHARLGQVDPAAAAQIRPQDLVRISRALEVFEQTGRPITELWREAAAASRRPVFAAVFDPPRDELRVRIDRRVDAMMAAGFLQEVQTLRDRGHGHTRALSSLGYRELSLHLDGQVDLPAAVADVKRHTVDYARRQRTWFRRETPSLLMTTPPSVADAAAAVDAWWRGLLRDGGPGLPS